MRIAKELLADSSLSNLALAEKVGLSPSPCLQRVRRLEKTGLIRRYKAVVDLSQLGASITVYAEVTLNTRNQNVTSSFERIIKEMRNVVSCHQVSGDYDYLLRIVARDLSHYASLADVVSERFPHVDKWHSYIAIRCVKDDAPLPIDDLIEPHGEMP
jgi:DNA-binding Lrp family transcriptional regulator